MAIVAALGLLILGAALLAGSAAASVELRRAARSRTAAARAESELRHALGAVVQGWQPALDSLPIGGRVEQVMPSGSATDQDIVVRAAVRRLSVRLYAATVVVTVGRDDVVLARRRAVLFLEGPVAAEGSAAAMGVAPLRGWSIQELQ